jgi:hypothetical protein
MPVATRAEVVVGKSSVAPVEFQHTVWTFGLGT